MKKATVLLLTFVTTITCSIFSSTQALRQMPRGDFYAIFVYSGALPCIDKAYIANEKPAADTQAARTPSTKPPSPRGDGPQLCGTRRSRSMAMSGGGSRIRVRV